MARIFDSLFGRDKKSEEPFPQLPSDLQSLDIEYIRYCVELEQTVTALEAYLHTSDDPIEIAKEALKAVCKFYGGNWAGILDVDLDLDIWNPLWWYNADGKDKTMALFGEFELAKSMPNWVYALENGTPIIILDIEAVKAEYPSEYEIYKRLQVTSVIGVPFGPNPVGILAIRNPTRYTKYPSAMNILAYVIHRAMAQQKTIESSKLALSHDKIMSDKDIIINFFGSMSIYTANGVLHERDFNSPKSSRVATYLMLNRKSAHSPLQIVSELWPESPDKHEQMSTYVRAYIRSFRQAFELISPYQLIVSSANGYQINRDLHIMTDLEQFDMLWEQAQYAVTVPHKVELLKEAVNLYKGPVFENACDEHWIIGIVTQYKLRYIGIVNELLAALDDAGDFTGVQQYATNAIRLVPENVRAHYWLIHAMNHLGTLELAKNQIAQAKRVLTAEEYATLKKYVGMDETLSYTVLFGED